MTAAASRPDLPDWLASLADDLDRVTGDTLSPRVPVPPAGARPSAVLMLFGEGPDGPDLLLTERASTLRSHAGELSFPGGRAERGDSGASHTALREAHEEVGLAPSSVDVLAELPPLWIPPSNSAVTTVVGWWRDRHPVAAADVDEVAAVLQVPLAHLLDPGNRFSVQHPSGWRGPAFAVGRGLVLWGFTAGIVARLFAYAGWERPWDPDRVESPPRPGTAARRPRPDAGSATRPGVGPG